jgi:hypothetical protein
MNMTSFQDEKFEVLIDDAIVELRSSLRTARCEFDFCTYKLITNEYSEELHKEALTIFFSEVDDQCDLKSATGTKLSKNQIKSYLQTANWNKGEAPLFSAFISPPYGTKWTDDEGLKYFEQWLSYLGWDSSDDLQILDWVGDPDVNPGRSGWSSYFQAGSEWWGIWCLTIWNPVRRTIGVLAASSTD